METSENVFDLKKEVDDFVSRIKGSMQGLDHGRAAFPNLLFANAKFNQAEEGAKEKAVERIKYISGVWGEITLAHETLRDLCESVGSGKISLDYAVASSNQVLTSIKALVDSFNASMDQEQPSAPVDQAETVDSSST